MNMEMTAAFWGLVSGMALLIGAIAGYFIRFRQTTIAAVMAFGSGVLISVLAFDLMDEAFQNGGVLAALSGFAAGALVYTGANELLARAGARHRKSYAQKAEDNGGAIAVGALLDGIPESMAIGMSLLLGEGVSLVAVIGIFLSNLPEGLSSASGMKQSGKSATYIFTLWTVVALVSGGAAWAGYALTGGLPGYIQAAITASAAGAVLAMIVDTMIPEAFARTQKAAGLITCLGFMSAFALSKTLA